MSKPDDKKEDVKTPEPAPVKDQARKYKNLIDGQVYDVKHTVGEHKPYKATRETKFWEGSKLEFHKAFEEL